MKPEPRPPIYTGFRTPPSGNSEMVKNITRQGLDAGIGGKRACVVGGARIKDAAAMGTLPVDEIRTVTRILGPLGHEPVAVLSMCQEGQAVRPDWGHPLGLRQAIHFVPACRRAIVRARSDRRSMLEWNRLRTTHEEVLGGKDAERRKRRRIPAIDPPHRLQAQQLAGGPAEVGPFAAGAAVGMPSFTPLVRRQPPDTLAGVAGLSRFQRPGLLVVGDFPECCVTAQANNVATTLEIRLYCVAHSLRPILVVSNDH